MNVRELELRRVVVPAVVALVGLGAAVALLRSAPPRPRPVLARERTRPLSAPFTVPTERFRVRVVTLTNALVRPWALAFLPGGDILITERDGRMRLMHDGQLAPAVISGFPPVDTRQQDGLMDLALHPRFAENHTLYFTYSRSGDRGDTTALGRARFENETLTDVRELFVADAWSTYGGNSGSRIAFGLDGSIFMSVGDRHEQKPAQDLRTHKGKILRLNDDGTIPADNPFIGRADVRPEIYAYGLRNPQGLFVEPNSGTLWEHEHGPRGGDEVNIIRAGHNYGWPAITFGINYDGSIISRDTAREGMDQPVVYWVPSISPSGLIIYSGDRFPAWSGNAFLGALSGQHLRRLELQNGHVTHEERLLVQMSQRVRDVRQGPDGFLYVLTDAGSLVRLEPAS